MDKLDAARIFNDPKDKYNLDLQAIRTLLLDVIERLNKLEEKKGKRK